MNKSPSGWLEFVKALRWVWFLNNCSKYNHHFSFNEKKETKETYIAFVDNFIFLICNWRQAYFPWELQTRFSVLQHRTKPPTWTHKNHWIILFLFFNINIFIFHWSLMHDLRLLYLRVRQVTLKCKYFFPCLVFVLALPGWITWLGIAGEALRVQMYLIFVPSTSEGHVSLWGGTKYEVFFRASRNAIFRVLCSPRQ